MNPPAGRRPRVPQIEGHAIATPRADRPGACRPAGAQQPAHPHSDRNRRRERGPVFSGTAPPGEAGTEHNSGWREAGPALEGGPGRPHPRRERRPAPRALTA